MDFKWTKARLEKIYSLLDEISDNVQEAVYLYGEDAIPTINISEQDVIEGRFKPGDYNEYRRLVRVLSNTTPESFKPHGKGISDFDVKFANMVERQYDKYRERTIEAYDEQIKELTNMRKNAKTRDQRESINEQLRIIRRAKKKVEAYDAFKPSRDDNESQFRRKVLGRQGATSAAYQSLRKALYQQNYLQALRHNNMSEENPLYKRIESMDTDDFIDFMDENPDLEDAMHYQIASLIDFDNKLQSAFDIYDAQRADVEDEEG